MGRALLERYPAARARYDEASDVLGFDLLAVCLEGPAERLDSTEVSQPALFVTSLAALDWLRHSTPEVVEGCVATAGLSLGEYTALVFAGVLDFASALRVVAERGRAMQAAADATAGGMVSILGWDPPRVAQLCDEARRPGETLQPANFLCPGNVAVSGHREACARAAELATAQGAMKAVPLAVAGAFHTQLMQPAVERLTQALAAVPLHRPRLPVVSNVDARPHDDPEEIRSLLAQQVVSPVRWEESLRWLVDQQVDAFYEVGPGRVLSGLLKRIDRKLKCEPVAV